MIATTLTPYGQETVTGNRRQFGITGYEEINLSTSRRRPLSLKLGMTQEIASLKVVFELGHTRWKDISQDSEIEKDYFNVTSYVFGMGIDISDKNSMNFAYGSFPSHIGDGIMDSRAADGREVDGVRFGDLNGVNLQAMSIGFTQKEILYDLNYYISLQQGTREVFEDARYYGDHAFTLLMFGAGGSWKI